MIIDGNVCPYNVANGWQKNCQVFEKQTKHSPFFTHVLIGPCQKMLMFHSYYRQVKSDTTVFEIRVRRARSCLMINLSTQPQLAENDGLWSCIRSFAFFWDLKTDTGKCKTHNAKIHVSISLSSSTGKISGHQVPEKLDLPEKFILSVTGRALIIPRWFVMYAYFFFILGETSPSFARRAEEKLLTWMTCSKIQTVDHTSCRNQPSHKVYGLVRRRRWLTFLF